LEDWDDLDDEDRDIIKDALERLQPPRSLNWFCQISSTFSQNPV
jgi:hypothetical protein